MTTRRAARRKRILINWIARKMRHRHVRGDKFKQLNKILYPLSGEEGGWGWSDEEGIIDQGGPAVLWRGPAPSKKDEKERMQDDSLSELRKCKPIINRWHTRDPIIRVWPEDMVKLNWTGELVPWESVKHRVNR
jgi:hypothetical protein